MKSKIAYMYHQISIEYLAEIVFVKCMFVQGSRWTNYESHEPLYFFDFYFDEILSI